MAGDSLFNLLNHFSAENNPALSAVSLEIPRDAR
jgi:hypothetical protein